MVPSAEYGRPDTTSTGAHLQAYAFSKPRRVATDVTDPVSSVMGSVLSKVTVFGAVVVGMKMALIGEFVLAVGLFLPLLLVVYLLATDGGLLA